MSAKNSWNPLRETITHGDQFSSLRPEDLEDAVAEAPTVAARVSRHEFTVGVPPSQDLTQAGEPIGFEGGCVPSSVSATGGARSATVVHFLDHTSSLEAWDKDASGDINLLGTQREVRYPEGSSRRSKGVSPASFCGDDVVRDRSCAKEPAGTEGLAPTSLVNNEAGHTATQRAPACAEPPRTGEEEEPVNLSGDTADATSCENRNGGSVNGDMQPSLSPGGDSNEPSTSTNRMEMDGSNDEEKSKKDEGKPTVHKPNGKVARNGREKSPDAEQPLPKSQRDDDINGKNTSKPSKPKSPVKNVKFREAGGHAVADDDIARCEAVADAFYKNPDDMDAFIEDILLMPQSQVYELSVRLGEGYRDWKEKALCNQFVKENPGSLWGSKFKDILIHKRDPVTMVLSCYSLATCMAMGGSTFKLGGREFQVPKYSQYANNYHVTFTKVNNPSLARALVKKLALMTNCVIAAFNPTSDQNVASPHLRVIFKSSSPPAPLVPKDGPPLREVSVVDPHGHTVTIVFQHKIAVFNKHVPPSVKARQRKPTSADGPSTPAAPSSSTKPSARRAASTSASPATAAPHFMPEESRPRTAGTRASRSAAEDIPSTQGDKCSNAGSDMSAVEHGRASLHDEEMEEPFSDPSTVNENDSSQVDATTTTVIDDVHVEAQGQPHNQPVPAPQLEEHTTSTPLEFQLVTGDRFNPAPKRPLSPRESQGFATPNRYALLQQDDVDLSLDDFPLPRLVLEDSEFPRVLIPKKKVKPNKSKHAHFERAVKLVREKVVETDMPACARLLKSEPQVVAHSMYPVEECFGLFAALATTRSVHRLMASRAANGQSSDYTTYLPFYAQGLRDPNDIARELVSNPSEHTVRLSLATVDLFLGNRAPDLYTNTAALEVLCGQPASRWEHGDVLTDWSIMKVISVLYPTLSTMNLPSSVGRALDFLVESIIDNYPDVDTLCDAKTHSIQAPAWEDLEVEA